MNSFNAVQFLRGTTEKINECEEILEPGQPLLNLDTEQLYIGTKEQIQIKDKFPINTRNIVVLLEDTASDGITSEQWKKLTRGDFVVEYKGNFYILTSKDNGDELYFSCINLSASNELLAKGLKFWGGKYWAEVNKNVVTQFDFDKIVYENGGNVYTQNVQKKSGDIALTSDIPSTATEEDITERNPNKEITTDNMDKAVVSALTDEKKIIPTPDQISQFKAAWGFTSSMLDGAVPIYNLSEISINSMNEATEGTIKEEAWENILDSEVICLKLNNEYYFSSDNEHTPGIKSYTHLGWDGTSRQTKSINITTETKAWKLHVGKDKYYRHYIKLTAQGRLFFYNISSTYGQSYTVETLPTMPDDSMTTFVTISNGFYSNISGTIYKIIENEPKFVAYGMITDNGTSFHYLQIHGVVIEKVEDQVVSI